MRHSAEPQNLPHIAVILNLDSFASSLVYFLGLLAPVPNSRVSQQGYSGAETMLAVRFMYLIIWLPVSHDHTLHINTTFISLSNFLSTLKAISPLEPEKISSHPSSSHRGRARGSSPCVSHLHTCVLMVSVCYCFQRTVDGSRGT